MALEKLVAFGGGTGLYTLLSGLKHFDVDITAVVSTTDNGGSSGSLRDEYGILPPGDIRKCLIALSDFEDMRDLFEYRFEKNGKLEGHSFGNLLLVALTDLAGGDFIKAIKKAEKILNVKENSILPCTLDKSTLHALLENGKRIVGEENIGKYKLHHNTEIKKIYMKPKTTAYKPVIKEIEKADIITIGPGSLYTSIIPNLVVDGISKAINKSNAKKAYIVNVMTEHGEEDSIYASHYVNEIEKYLQGKLDYVIVNTAKAPEKLLRKYEQEYKKQVIADIENIGAKIIKGDFLKKKNLLRHDSYKLAKAIDKIMEE